jgi:ferredoxin
MHEHVRVGDLLDTSAPRGTFVLGEASAPLVLLSGGVGVTPMLAMLYAAVAERSQHKREIWWIHSTRNGASQAFAREVRDMLAGLDGVHAWVAYSRPGPTDSLGVDYGHQGHVDAPWLGEIGIPKDGDFYLCGPPAFMTALEGGLGPWGVAADRLHSEAFGSGPSLTPGVVGGGPLTAPHQPDGPQGSGASVTFLRSGLTTRWDPRFNSLLQLAEACSVPVRWSCRTGVCHNCESGLVDGQVRYDPQPLDPPADGSLLICCSTPTSDIELDL